MKLLLDTHVVMWAIDAPENLTAAQTLAIQEPQNERWVSVASMWELGIKSGIGELKLRQRLLPWMQQLLVTLDAQLLPVGLLEINAAAGLPQHHGDPFDRMIIAQAETHGLVVVSADSVFSRYGVPLIS